MDKNVSAAMAKWPDVPDVYGWLSLSEQGQWRLHPDGDAWAVGQLGSSSRSGGESIESDQIRSFIDRNYGCDPKGQWYFQNGPQRVYVRLDAAPFVLFINDRATGLRTHNSQAVTQTNQWWLDEAGRLYAVTEFGPGLVAGRDTDAVVQKLYTANGRPLLESLEALPWPMEPADTEATAAGSPAAKSPANAPSPSSPSISVQFAPIQPNGEPNTPLGVLSWCKFAELETKLGFVRYPQPSST